MANKRPTDAERLELLRNGETVCVICGRVMDAFGGGKTRKGDGQQHNRVCFGISIML